MGNYWNAAAYEQGDKQVKNSKAFNVMHWDNESKECKK